MTSRQLYGHCLAERVSILLVLEPAEHNFADWRL